jgi:mannose-6-phosphate isomerase-like protein (cupin superfamily)
MTALDAWPALDLGHVDAVRHRHGEHGPGYLARGPVIDVGVLRLRPGDETVNHFHRRLEECFVVLEGRAEMWLDGGEHHVELEPGQFYRSPAGEMHYFRNRGTDLWRAVFIKAPYDPQDTNPVPWRPGEILNRSTELLARLRAGANR